MTTESAKVTITGTPEKPVFNFVIPSGAKGERGLQGDKGTTGLTPQLQMGQVNTIANPSDQEWIAGMIRKSPVVTAALSETFPSTMRGEKGEKGDGGMPVGLIAADLDNYKSDGYYKMEAGADDMKNLPPTLVQKYGTLVVVTTNGVNRLEQIFYPTATSQGGKVFFIRSMAGNVWSPWRAITYQRVDNTAGKAIYTWDDVSQREQLIYGDTGLRDISSSITGAAGQLLVRRNGYIVTVTANAIIPTATTADLQIGILPAGFRPFGGNPDKYMIPTSTTGTKSMFSYNSGQIMVWNNPAPTDNIRFNLTYVTNDPWPTTLPGVGIGNIPNL